MAGDENRSADPVRVLLNPRAGGGTRTDPERLASTLASAGVTAEVEAVDPGELARRVRACSDRSMLAVAGGDGSHRTAASGLVGGSTALAPIPTGHLNHFARRAGLATVAAAGAAIRDGHQVSIPLGRVGGEVFLDTAVVGAYPDFIQVRERLRSKLTTWPAAAIAALLTLARWPRVPITIRSPHGRIRVRTAMLWVGVGRHSFPAPHEAPLPSDDDVLQVVVLPGGRRSALKLARTLMRYHRRGPEALTGNDMTVHDLRWIELDSPTDIPIALDGEPRSMRPPLRLDLAPELLRVVVPRG